MKEVYKGVCGTHIGGQALASKVPRVGYYWLTLKRDCTEFVKIVTNANDSLTYTKPFWNLSTRWTGEISHSSHRLLHQMGGSRADSDNIDQKS
ncbi:hypothetical protein CR513_25714, partial [Mucuna pruriens]